MDKETDLTRRGPATPDGYWMCAACGHHTSAYCGRCTALVLEADGRVGYCGCDCRVAAGGKPLTEVIARHLHGKEDKQE